MYAIITDTSANIPTPLLREKHIGVLPFSYYVDGEEVQCLDTEAFDGHAYYQSIRDGKEVTTSQIPPSRFEEVFTPYLQAGRDIIFVSMSSGISGSCNSARLAAEELMERFPGRRVEVVDTIGASLGEGIVALAAAERRDRGLSFDENVSSLRAMSVRMCQVFTVDDLMHLKRMGRLSGITARVGSVLNLKPILKGNEEGKIVAFNVARGRKRSVEALAKIYNKFVELPEIQTVGIAHADCPDDAAYLEAMLKLEKPPKEILTVCYEPVTGAHVGPDTLALFFLSNDTVRSANLLSDIVDRLPMKNIRNAVEKLPFGGKKKE